MAIYDPKSMHAEEFINDEEIRATLAYAEANKNNVALIDQLLEVDGKSVLLSVNGREERRKQPLAQAREYVGSLLTLLNKHAPRMADGKPLLPGYL